ncbi:hypothetical protein [Nonomuraea sp. NPDC050202]|uniref:hypothetical protein n=1 Tax=Nonomuraea sp. NPDC050202 TaxID=3155035 RepID=UPI0033D03662
MAEPPPDPISYDDALAYARDRCENIVGLIASPVELLDHREQIEAEVDWLFMALDTVQPQQMGADFDNIEAARRAMIKQHSKLVMLGRVSPEKPDIMDAWLDFWETFQEAIEGLKDVVDSLPPKKVVRPALSPGRLYVRGTVRLDGGERAG